MIWNANYELYSVVHLPLWIEHQTLFHDDELQIHD